jgi:hypothetical protein
LDWDKVWTKVVTLVESFPSVSHFACMHWNRVDSRLLVVESQIASLTPSPSLNHNLCYRCPNGSCKAILDIYTSRPFQQYQERPNARCFGPYNHTLSFQESQSTPKSHFRECEWRPHNSFKVGLRHLLHHAWQLKTIQKKTRCFRLF